MKQDPELEKVLRSMKTEHLQALHCVAKTRAKAFFKDPRAMLQLRKALNRRKQ